MSTIHIEIDRCPDYGFTAPFWVVSTDDAGWEYEHTGIGRIHRCRGRFATREQADTFAGELSVNPTLEGPQRARN